MGKFCTVFGFKGVHPEDLHCTHKFLDDLSDEEAAKVVLALRAWFDRHEAVAPKALFNNAAQFGPNGETRVLRAESAVPFEPFSDLREKLDVFHKDWYQGYQPHVTTQQLPQVDLPIDRYMLLYDYQPIYVTYFRRPPFPEQQQMAAPPAGQFPTHLSEFIARITIERRPSDRGSSKRVLYAFIDGKFYSTDQHPFHAHWLKRDPEMQRLPEGTEAYVGSLVVRSDGDAFVDVTGPLQRFRKRLKVMAEDLGADNIKFESRDHQRYVKRGKDWDYTDIGFPKVAWAG